MCKGLISQSCAVSFFLAGYRKVDAIIASENQTWFQLKIWLPQRQVISKPQQTVIFTISVKIQLLFYAPSDWLWRNVDAFVMRWNCHQSWLYKYFRIWTLLQHCVFSLELSSVIHTMHIVNLCDCQTHGPQPTGARNVDSVTSDKCVITDNISLIGLLYHVCYCK